VIVTSSTPKADIAASPSSRNGKSNARSSPRLDSAARIYIADTVQDFTAFNLGNNDLLSSTKECMARHFKNSISTGC